MSLSGAALRGAGTATQIHTSSAVMGYLEAQQGAESRTAFRTAEKLYKRYKNDTTQSRRNAKNKSGSCSAKVPPVNLSQVIDFRKVGEMLSNGSASSSGVSRLDGEFEWPVYTMAGRPGFYFIPGALDLHQQAYWISECMASFPQPPNRTNHDALHGPLEGLWSAAQSDHVLAEVITERDTLQSTGCATSQGQSADCCHSKRPIPADLATLAAQLARPASQGDEFHAEAAIINYYGPDDMLGGHIDDMEADLSKPLVSISLGCKAIFLLGGETRDEPPIAMFLRSGDAVLMAGPTRRCFHGIPRTFVDANESELPDFHAPLPPTCMTDSLLAYIAETRINMNIRQVY